MFERFKVSRRCRAQMQCTYGEGFLLPGTPNSLIKRGGGPGKATSARNGWGGSVARPAPRRWSPFCYPVGPTVFWLCKVRALAPRITLREQVLRYRWHLWVVSLERVTQPGQKYRFSTHVDPGSAPSSPVIITPAITGPPAPSLNVWERGGGGAAGYCPRVRCAYCTVHFITIAGRNRQG